MMVDMSEIKQGNETAGAFHTAILLALVIIFGAAYMCLNAIILQAAADADGSLTPIKAILSMSLFPFALWVMIVIMLAGDALIRWFRQRAGSTTC